MPQLLRNVEQNWQIIDEADTHWLAEDDWRAGEPLQVGVESEPDRKWLDASAIAVDFPALTDGRGLSLAVLLRTRLYYTGDWGARQRAPGHRYCFCEADSTSLNCGGKDLNIALKWVSPYTEYYQASVANPKPLFAAKN